METPFAEVIESSIIEWRAQSWQWNIIPKFGSLVTIKSADKTIFGIVYNIQTGPQDSYRTVVPFGKTEEELKREQPQIFSLLKTTFHCLILGYKEKDQDKILYQISPEPPKIHTFVYYSSKEENKQFFSNEQYLHILFNYSNNFFSLDELLLAILKNLTVLSILNSTILEKFIETYSILTANDYRKLKLFLQRATYTIKLQNKFTQITN